MVNTMKSKSSSFNRSGEEEEKPRSVAWMWFGFGFFVLFLSFVLSFIAFFSPFWYIELNTDYSTGLWGRCFVPELNCIWFLERDNAWEKSLPSWHVAAQILYAIGIILLFFTLVIAIFQLIFRCCKTKFTLPIINGALILIATLFMLLSIIVFGVGAYRQYEVSLNSWVGNFIWAFYVGIAALFVDAAAGLMFLYGGRIWVKEMRGYESAAYM